MIIFLGLAGSGKSTQSQLLAKRLGCPWISTGQLLRDNIKNKVILNKMLAGEMLDDELLFSLLDKKLKKLAPSEFILDGSPRTLHQAKWVVEKIKLYQIKLTAVIHLKTSKDVVRERLLRRARPDDTPAAIAERFKEYDKTIVPILEYLRGEDLDVYEVNGEISADKVDDEILKLIGRKNES